MSEAQIKSSALASDVPRPNQIVNPGLENWQRGNGPFTVGNNYTADRWIIFLGGTSTVSISRDNTGGGNDGGVYAAAIAYTQGTNRSLFVQKMEDWVQLRLRQLSFSFRVKASVANAVRAYASIDGTVTDILGTSHSGGGGWETLSIVVPVSPGATSLYVGLSLLASATVNADNAMLAVAVSPVDYQPVHPADDVARCMRYYEVHGSVSGWPYLYTYQVATANVGVPIPFHVQKAISPTATKNGTWSVSGGTGQPQAIVINKDGYSYYMGPSSGGTVIMAPDTADDTFVFEANP